MFKNIAALSLLSLILSTTAFAQTSLFDENKNNVDAQIDNEVKKVISISPEEIVDMSKGMDIMIEKEIRYAKPNEVYDLVRFNNYLNRDFAKSNGLFYKGQKIDPNNKKQVSKFYNSFKPDLGK